MGAKRGGGREVEHGSRTLFVGTLPGRRYRSDNRKGFCLVLERFRFY